MFYSHRNLFLSGVGLAKISATIYSRSGGDVGNRHRPDMHNKPTQHFLSKPLHFSLNVLHFFGLSQFNIFPFLQRQVPTNPPLQTNDLSQHVLSKPLQG